MNFFLGVPAESLRAKIDRKSTISLHRCQFYPNRQTDGESDGRAPSSRLDRPAFNAARKKERQYRVTAILIWYETLPIYTQWKDKNWSTRH